MTFVIMDLHNRLLLYVLYNGLLFDHRFFVIVTFQNTDLKDLIAYLCFQSPKNNVHMADICDNLTQL